MFQSVSGHNSEQSIAHYRSRPTVLQPNRVSDTMSNCFENHQPQRTEISTVAYAFFIQNTNQMASIVDHNRKFSERILSTPAISKTTSNLTALKADLMTKTDFIFPAFSLRFVAFAVLFSRDHLSQVSLWRNFSGLITIPCYAQLHSVQTTDYVKWLFPCLLQWAKAGFGVIEKELKKK